MTGRAIRVASRGAERAAVGPPRRPDGSLYRFELIERDDEWRAYADDAAALMAELVPGYAEADPLRQQEARQGLAVQAQVLSQAMLLIDRGVDGCTGEQRAVLEGNRDTPPELVSWSAPVPLLLVEDFYAPTGELSRPAPVAGGEIVWIDARNDEALLRSLHRLGWLTLAEAD